MANKCIFCPENGTRFRVHDGITYWLCDTDYYQHPYGDIVIYHNEQKLKENQTEIAPKFRKRKQGKRKSVEMIEH